MCVSPLDGGAEVPRAWTPARLSPVAAKVTPMSLSESKTGFVFYFLLQTFFLDINHNLDAAS